MGCRVIVFGLTQTSEQTRHSYGEAAKLLSLPQKPVSFVIGRRNLPAALLSPPLMQVMLSAREQPGGRMHWNTFSAQKGACQCRVAISNSMRNTFSVQKMAPNKCNVHEHTGCFGRLTKQVLESHNGTYWTMLYSMLYATCYML